MNLGLFSVILLSLPLVFFIFVGKLFHNHNHNRILNLNACTVFIPTIFCYQIHFIAHNLLHYYKIREQHRYYNKLVVKLGVLFSKVQNNLFITSFQKHI